MMFRELVGTEKENDNINTNTLRRQNAVLVRNRVDFKEI